MKKLSSDLNPDEPKGLALLNNTMYQGQVMCLQCQPATPEF